MKNTLFAAIAATALLAGAVPALAESETTSTTTTWSNDQGADITKYSTTQNFTGVSDPSRSPVSVCICRKPCSCSRCRYYPHSGCGPLQLHSSGAVPACCGTHDAQGCAHLGSIEAS